MPKIFQMPNAVSITGRSSSITNSFINGIIPTIEPTEEEVLEALQILGMDPSDVRCAYCGDKYTEWDHLRPLIMNQEPTGYISEIGNLVPACGKCNQSKGNKYWRTWMLSQAVLSPKSRNIIDIEIRIQRLENYERWKIIEPLDFEQIVGTDIWKTHRENWRSLLDEMRRSQKHALEIKAIVKAYIKQNRS
jgi:HNH endonuclease